MDWLQTLNQAVMGNRPDEADSPITLDYGDLSGTTAAYHDRNDPFSNDGYEERQRGRSVCQFMRQKSKKPFGQCTRFGQDMGLPPEAPIINNSLPMTLDGANSFEESISFMRKDDERETASPHHVNLAMLQLSPTVDAFSYQFQTDFQMDGFKYSDPMHKDINQVHRNQNLCEVCGNPFSRSDALGRHQDIHKEKRQRYECTGCGRSFTRRDTLKRHKRKHCHGPGGGNQG
ncbi:hypothetical protein QBC33DRAFT_619377 [Phialemonium atrogriseum]|uniref:C2H2-type domain-containing protein n=1 Tax=Phialemonium atrogriseum TaxID=1093897 RepID=A0AAJ0C0J2_9PEZI|nr:uncharacterized protein QBC33DRAFT_619377 [Phialemonium atrogriseum]KAK1767915.1 hypothetical protein QBC33DRAFT_619377 [Phialemonium atrogriseum]